MKEDYRR